jgi:hypothetical protein
VAVGVVRLLSATPWASLEMDAGLQVLSGRSVLLGSARLTFGLVRIAQYSPPCVITVRGPCVADEIGEGEKIDLNY